MDSTKAVSYQGCTSEFTAFLTSQVHLEPAVTHGRRPAEGAPNNMNNKFPLNFVELKNINEINDCKSGETRYKGTISKKN